MSHTEILLCQELPGREGLSDSWPQSPNTAAILQGVSGELFPSETVGSEKKGSAGEGEMLSLSRIASARNFSFAFLLGLLLSVTSFLSSSQALHICNHCTVAFTGGEWGVQQQRQILYL